MCFFYICFLGEVNSCLLENCQCRRNYRPISHISVFCKIYERVIKDQMLAYLRQHQLTNHNRYEFLSRHSTCTQLLYKLITTGQLPYATIMLMMLMMSTLILLKRSAPSVIRICCTSWLLLASLVNYSIVWLISDIILLSELRYLTYLTFNTFQVASRRGHFRPLLF